MAKKTKPQAEKRTDGILASKTKLPKTTKLATRNGQLRALTSLENKIVKLLQEHATAVLKLGENSNTEQVRAKLDERLVELMSPDRLHALEQVSAGPLKADAIENIFRELVSAERVHLSPIRVAYLGPAHSYSHLATLDHFGASTELAPVQSIATVFEEVAQGHADRGVVPIENSTDGRIVDTLDMFTKSLVKICGEIPLPIHHNLLGAGTRDQVKEVCSKPQAISQCRQWLVKHMPNAKVSAMSSTTAAAKKAAKNPEVAAIASRQAGVQYGLRVLAKNIEDNKSNVTRFAVIGSEPAKKTGNDKTSLMFELKHEPGALASAMSIFKNRRLNLTWIESFPKPDSPNEYLFFVEFLGHQVEARVRRALELLEKKSVRLEVLGSYPIAAK